MFEHLDPIEVTVPGPECPPKLKHVGGQPVIVHYGNVPESDITVHKGIRVSTPLRTVIDLAPRVTRDHLVLIVEDCLERGLFTVEDGLAAWASLTCCSELAPCCSPRCSRRWVADGGVQLVRRRDDDCAIVRDQGVAPPRRTHSDDPLGPGAQGGRAVVAAMTVVSILAGFTTSAATCSVARACGGQMITCGCRYDEDPPDPDDEYDDEEQWDEDNNDFIHLRYCFDGADSLGAAVQTTPGACRGTRSTGNGRLVPERAR